MAERGQHLSSLFNEGKETTVVYPNKPDTLLWVTRPNNTQHERATRAARIRKARRRSDLTSKDSPETLTIDIELDEMTKPELVDAMLDDDKRDLERRAFHEVLFSEEDKDRDEEGTGTTPYGTFWGPEGVQYTDVIDAVAKRLEEIEDHNRELRAADIEEGHINLLQDEELERLNETQEVFLAETTARYEDLRKMKQQEIGHDSIDKLRKNYRAARVDLECDVVWFEEFKMQQLFFAFRYPDNHKELYFKDADAVRDLPPPVIDQLMDAFDSVDLTGDDLKNSLTPLPS